MPGWISSAATTHAARRDVVASLTSDSWGRELWPNFDRSRLAREGPNVGAPLPSIQKQKCPESWMLQCEPYVTQVATSEQGRRQ